MAQQSQIKVKVGQNRSHRNLVHRINFGNILSGCKSVRKLLFRSGPAGGPDHQTCRTFLEMNLGDWNLDVFAFADLANGKPLTELVTAIFQKRAIPTAFKIPESTLNNFLSCLEDQYDDKVPYHNSSHAADVTHCAHVLLNSPALEGTFTELEIFATLFAAAIHDVGHPGWSNGFFAKIRKDAQGGSREGRSYLEERHLLITFQILNRANCDILCGLGALHLTYFERLVTDMVLATDMARHSDLKALVQRLVQQQGHSGVQNPMRLPTYNEKIMVLQFALHCADLSNPTKRFNTYKRSVVCLSKERFQLGDQEKLLDLPVSPNCDRNNASVPKTQVSFITGVVQPLWKLWHELVRDEASAAILKSIESNLESFRNRT